MNRSSIGRYFVVIVKPVHYHILGVQHLLDILSYFRYIGVISKGVVNMLDVSILWLVYQVLVCMVQYEVGW